jgi:hypothetical protein
VNPRKWIVAVAALALVVACEPATTGPVPPAAPRYVVFLTVIDSDETEPEREIDCTVIAYAADKVIMVKDAKTGVEKPVELDITLTVPKERRLSIDDQAGADRIEFICTMLGEYGDSLDCEVTDAVTGHLAAMFGSQDYDLIDNPLGGLATCAGSINVKA